MSLYKAVKVVAARMKAAMDEDDDLDRKLNIYYQQLMISLVVAEEEENKPKQQLTPVKSHRELIEEAKQQLRKERGGEPEENENQAYILAETGDTLMLDAGLAVGTRTMGPGNKIIELSEDGQFHFVV